LSLLAASVEETSPAINYFDLLLLSSYFLLYLLYHYQILARGNCLFVLSGAEMQPRHEGVLGSGGIAPRILWLRH